MSRLGKLLIGVGSAEAPASTHAPVAAAVVAAVSAPLPSGGDNNANSTFALRIVNSNNIPGAQFVAILMALVGVRELVLVVCLTLCA